MNLPNFLSGNVSVTSTASAAITTLTSESEKLLETASQLQDLIKTMNANDPKRNEYEEILRSILNSISRMSTFVVRSSPK